MSALIVSLDPNHKISTVKDDATENNFTIEEVDDISIKVTEQLISSKKIADWIKKYCSNNNFAVIYDSKRSEDRNVLRHHTKIRQQSNLRQMNSYTDTVISYFPNEVAKIYKFPTIINNKITIGVIALGGTINIDEIKKYWQSKCKISASNLPNIVIVSADGSTTNPKVVGYEIETTLDVEIVGACCPSKNTNIIVYHAQNTFAGFYTAFSKAINDKQHSPQVISCSWGIPEVYFAGTSSSNINAGKSTMYAFDNLFKNAMKNGINICCATGDNAASDGVSDGFPHVDFPASSPNVIACGGTSLTSTNKIYDNNTVETAWSFDPLSDGGGGGGYSAVFSKPIFQESINSTSHRSIPDVSANSDPTTGYNILFGNSMYVIGGTSCASPLIASLIALSLAGKRLSVVSSFYNNPTCVNKIKSGSIGYYSCNSNGDYSLCCGLGSINGEQISKLISNIKK